MDFTAVEEVCKKYGARFGYDIPAKSFTSFAIGGKCEMAAYPNSDKCAAELSQVCKKGGIPLYVLGKGSNVLVSDDGLKGVVMLLSTDFSDITVNDTELVCKAGTPLIKLCRTALDEELAGLEFAYGIPGSVGGALYMNAGAYGGEMRDVVKSCRYVDESGKIAEMNAADMALGYRRSAFTGGGRIITEVTFSLKKGKRSEISAVMNELMERRRDKQPLEYPSAGSTFKRPEGDFASRLIDVSGLRGFSVGGAQVSEKHCGFVVNKGGATFADVMGLIDAVKRRVAENTGVTLECEVEILE